MRTIYVAPDLPPVAAAPDPQLSDPPRDRDLKQQETIDFWNVDRSAAKACFVQKHAAVSAIKGASK